jgi:hypothetical protein
MSLSGLLKSVTGVEDAGIEGASYPLPIQVLQDVVQRHALILHIRYRLFERQKPGCVALPVRR